MAGHRNAMRWYDFDPFEHVPREQATVGALRKQAEGHDVSVRSRSHRIIAPADKLEAFRAMSQAAASQAAASQAAASQRSAAASR